MLDHVIDQTLDFLENMPKDDSLLKILTQLLDTITFFRISETEKEFVEKEYQHKVKNAIWSAVPNFGVILAGGNPLQMGIALASQVLVDVPEIATK